MAFNVKETAPESSERDLVTGVVNLSVVALNPTLAELNTDLGRNYKEEPAYVGTNQKSGKAQTQIDIYLGGEVRVYGEEKPAKIMDKATFWVEDSTSRGIYIDKFGKFGKDQSKLDGGSARLAYNGEIDLVQFLKSLCNLGPKDEAGFTPAEISALASKGDLKALQEVISSASKNQVRVLAGVKDGKYQQLFGRHFDYAGGTDNSYLHKTFVKQQTGAYPVAGYFGPIQVLNDTYIPGNYMARRYSAEEEQDFQMKAPQGSFGAPAGQPAFGQPAATQPFSTAGAFPSQNLNPGLRAQPAMQPIGSDDDNDLPF